MSGQIILEKARHVVEDLLDVGGLIDEHQQEIYEVLEKVERRALDISEGAREVKASADEIFIVESLPAIMGIILTCRPENFERAKQYLLTIMPRTEAASGLSFLTLFYIVEKAWRRFRNSPSEHRKTIWECIRGRVRRLV